MSLPSPTSANSDRNDLQSPTAVLTESLLSTKAATQVQSPPPSKDKNSPEALAVKAATREKVLDEIVSTERLYLSSLQLIQSVYAKPLQTPSLQSELGVTPSQMKTIFSNLDALSGFHVILEEELRSSLSKAHGDEKVVQVSKVFEKYGDFLRMYTSYVNNYQQSLQQLTQLLTNKKWSKWLQENKPKSKDMDLMSLLIMPVQRIPRYELLLREVARQSTGAHPELDAAMQKVAEIAVHINETKRLVDRVADLLAIQARLAGSLPADSEAFAAGSLYAPHRRLVREGELTKRGSGMLASDKSRRYYLFNDILLWTNSHDKYKSHLALRNVEAGPVDPTPEHGGSSIDFSTAFQLTTHIPTVDGFKVGEKILLFCQSVYERDGWMKDLDVAVDEATDQATSNGLSSVVLPTRVRRMSDMNKAAAAAAQHQLTVKQPSLQMDSVLEVNSPEPVGSIPIESAPASTVTSPVAHVLTTPVKPNSRAPSLGGGRPHDRTPSTGGGKLNGRTLTGSSDSLRSSLGVTSPDPVHPRTPSPGLAGRLLPHSRRGSTQTMTDGRESPSAFARRTSTQPHGATDGRESPSAMGAVPIHDHTILSTESALTSPIRSPARLDLSAAAATPTPQEEVITDPVMLAQRTWHRASQAMYKISRNDLTALKSLKTPTPNVKLAMEALGCLVGAGEAVAAAASSSTGATTPRGTPKKPGLHVADDWTSLHALLVKPNFLTILRDFNERQGPVSERAEKKIASLVDVPSMSEASITKASPAVGVLWTWVLSYWRLKKIGGEGVTFMPPTPVAARPMSARQSPAAGAAGGSATPRMSMTPSKIPQTPRTAAAATAAATVAASASATASGAPASGSSTSRPACASIYKIHRKNVSSTSSISSIASNMSTLSTQSEMVGGRQSLRPSASAASLTPRGLSGASTTRIGQVKIKLVSSRPISAVVSTSPAAPAAAPLPLPPFSELVKCKTQSQDRCINYYHPPTKVYYEAHIAAPMDFSLLGGSPEKNAKLAKLKVSEAAHAARVKAAMSPRREPVDVSALPPSTFGKSESRSATPAPESTGAPSTGARLPASRAPPMPLASKLPIPAAASSSSTKKTKINLVPSRPSGGEEKPSTSRSSSLKKHRLSAAMPKKE